MIKYSMIFLIMFSCLQTTSRKDEINDIKNSFIGSWQSLDETNRSITFYPLYLISKQDNSIDTFFYKISKEKSSDGDFLLTKWNADFDTLKSYVINIDKKFMNLMTLKGRIEKYEKVK